MVVIRIIFYFYVYEEYCIQIFEVKFGIVVIRSCLYCIQVGFSFYDFFFNKKNSQVWDFFL